MILAGKELPSKLPILRHLFPSRKFRTDALNLARVLSIPLEIPEHNRIPLGFRSAFDTLRADSDHLISQSKQQHQSAIDSLIERLLVTPVTWQATGDGELPHHIDFDGQSCQIRVNDWPEHKTVYSLIIASQCVRDLHSLPDHWKRPETNQ